jgi:flagellar assembly protein FliH
MKDLSNKGIIPADQLDQWRSWSPGELETPLSGLSAAQMEALSAAGGQGGDETPEEGEPAREHGYPTAAELEAIHQEAWQAGHDAGLASGQEAGREQGLAQGQAEGRASAEQRFKDAWQPLQTLAGHFSQQLQNYEIQMSGEVLSFAVKLAERLVAAHLAVDARAIEPLLREALSALPSSLAQGRLRVNPQDLAVAREFLQLERPETVWQWVEDPAVARGGCLLETPALRLNLTLPSRMRAIGAALGLEGDDDEPA